MTLEWKAQAMQAYCERGLYVIERDSWNVGWELRFTAMLPGWPRSEPVRIDPSPDADGNARDWETLEAAFAAAERHASLFVPQLKRAAGAR